MKKTKQKWCLRILIWLVAVLVLLGVADSCRVQEDPHRTLVQGSLQELNDSWTLETDQQAVYDIPESMGESLMLSIRSTKQKFSLGLRAADGQETAFYTYDPGSGPAEMRLFAALPEGAAGKTLVLRCAEPSALSAMLSSKPVLATQTKLSGYYFRRSFYALAFFLLCVLCAVELGVLMVTMHQHLHSGGPPSDPGADRADAGRRHLDTDGFRAAGTGDGQGESRRVRLTGHLQPHSAFRAGIHPLHRKE